jgi:hypothetical protein
MSDTEDAYFDAVHVVDTPKKGASVTTQLATTRPSLEEPGSRQRTALTTDTGGGYQGESVRGGSALTAYAVGAPPPAIDQGFLQNLFSGLENALVMGLQGRQTMAPDTSTNTKALRDVVRSAIKPLDTTAADMTHALKVFFEPIEAYFDMANAGDMTCPEQDKGRVVLLKSVMGPDCAAALVDLEPEEAKTYAQLKAAIKKHFDVPYDPVHALGLVRNAVMRADETTKQYVTRLWGLAYKLREMSAYWKQIEVLTSLRYGHACEKVRES